MIDAGWLAANGWRGGFSVAAVVIGGVGGYEIVVKPSVNGLNRWEPCNLGYIRLMSAGKVS